jgi:alpha-L-fucosidase 2
MKFGYTTFLVFTIFYSSLAQSPPAKAKQNLTLWYDKPAKDWNEALPVGNGRLGAMVFGGTVRERIQLNEESLWSGSKVDANPTVEPRKLKEIQQLILDSKIQEAQNLANKTIMSSPAFLRSYQPLGDFFIDYSNEEWTSSEVRNYRRELDLRTGIAKTVFTRIDQTITQEVFASSPDNVIVVRISTDNPGKLSLKAFLSRTQDATFIATDSNRIRMSGKIVDPPSLNSGPAGVHMAFEGQVLGFTDGNMLTSNNAFLVENATSAVFYITAATDYNLAKLDFDRSINPEERCTQILKDLTVNAYPLVLDRHLKEFGSLFNRVDLNLNGKNMESIPTNQRLENLRNGAEDMDLLSLYFQYGRYLLMSSSRSPGVLPANLQGIWNQDFEAPWDADYHTNINIQMNYWPAEVCNLSETKIPYSNFVNALRIPGKITAMKMYGANGWTMHHATDPFGRTSIVDAVDVGGFPIAASWLVLQLWDHYRFTGDKEYLKKQAYPVMKEAAEFILDFLIKDKNGRWATAPSNSPENKYFLPNVGKFMLTYSATIDIQIINELFNSLQSASVVLGMDKEFIERLKDVQANLPQVKVSKKYNTVQEWIEDYDESEPGHRHISPLFGLYPGTSITKEDTIMFRAANTTIERRLSSGGGHTGWSRAWIINFYARLLNGDKAYEHLTLLLKKSTLNNLFDNHPPFQIDGNFGGTAGIAEMLLQSQSNSIDLLPALPTAWKNGNVAGLKARGNFEVSMQWIDNKLSKATVKSSDDKECIVNYGTQTVKFKMKKGQVLVLNGELKIMRK